MKRRGLRVTPYQYCRQYEAFCKGFFLHQSGKVNEALLHYTFSLEEGGKYSSNRLRLQCLEAIELVIKEKTQLEKQKIQKIEEK